MFEMYDVGGQRNERRKWVNCFENVRAPASLDAGVGDAPPLLGDERALRRVAQRLRREDVRGRDDEPHEGRARPLRGGLRQPPLLERVDAALPQQARPLRGQGRGGPHRRGQRLPGLRRQSERLRRRRPLLHGQVPAEEQGPGADDLLPRHVRDGHVQRPRGHGHVLPRHHPEEAGIHRLHVMRRPPPPRRPRVNPKSPCRPCTRACGP
mmetsp:Transcript_4326/g.14513  ORF Transcript_4326/g.14513 Transcript_4326/m.14513 type:complete len:209 (+) Transcript_4326:1188-1814(+)